MEWWMSEVRSMHSDAALVSAKIHQLSGAVELLEENRARSLRDALERNRRDLERLTEIGHADLYQHYLTASGNWRNLLAAAVRRDTNRFLDSSQKVMSTKARAEIQPR
jgi:hypothetical protein